MPYVPVEQDASGIRALMESFPETAPALNQLADQVLRGESPLSPGERELIASYVSHQNDCEFCAESHSAVTRHLLDDETTATAVLDDPSDASIEPRLEALLAIADSVRACDREVTSEEVEQAREEGASDREIHDTVLVAASFCLFNRYVDGLDAPLPDDPSAYETHGKRLAEQGYHPD